MTQREVNNQRAPALMASQSWWACSASGRFCDFRRARNWAAPMIRMARRFSKPGIYSRGPENQMNKPATARKTPGAKVNRHHKYSEKKVQVLTMFGMNCSLMSLQKAILWKILNGLKLFFPSVSTNKIHNSLPS